MSEIFEQHREEILLATNYLEALCTRLLIEAQGGTPLTPVAEMNSGDPIEAA